MSLSSSLSVDDFLAEQKYFFLNFYRKTDDGPQMYGKIKLPKIVGSQPWNDPKEMFVNIVGAVCIW